jgi:hypothetical protein
MPGLLLSTLRRIAFVRLLLPPSICAWNFAGWEGVAALLPVPKPLATGNPKMETEALHSVRGRRSRMEYPVARAAVRPYEQQ